MHRKPWLSYLAFLFIAPISLLALLMTALLIAAYLGQLGDAANPLGPSLVLYPIVIGGWIGLVALWRSYFHFRDSDHSPPRARWYLAGLAIGCLVSLTLAALALNFSFVGLALLLGSPLVAAALLVARIVRSRVGV
jgi:hypothetical protein